MRGCAQSIFAAALLAVLGSPALARTRPIAVKVVVITMFEVGQDTGDVPGELQAWVERDHLDRVYPLPAGYHSVRMNSRGEMAVLTGRGTANAAATIMALGLDPRFDLRHAYWLVAGIAGATPERASLGSAAWARWVVDGDLGYEIDARELPKGWTTGHVPLHKATPFEGPALPEPGQVYQLNTGLADWAYALTRNTPLPDSPQLKEIRAKFDGADAQKPPFVTMGDEISSSTYWHGKLLDQWASDWVSYFTGGKGIYVTTAMEDTGTLQSLTNLARAGRVDFNRVMVLRAISNYDQQPHGLSVAQSLAAQRTSQFGAYLPSLEAAYRVGHVVVEELLDHWSRYAKADIGTEKARQER